MLFRAWILFRAWVLSRVWTEARCDMFVTGLLPPFVTGRALAPQTMRGSGIGC
jgi:hypothetical protein